MMHLSLDQIEEIAEVIREEEEREMGTIWVPPMMVDGEETEELTDEGGDQCSYLSSL